VALGRPAHNLLMVAKESNGTTQSLLRDCSIKISDVLKWRPRPIIGYLQRCSVIAVRRARGGQLTES